MLRGASYVLGLLAAVVLGGLSFWGPTGMADDGSAIWPWEADNGSVPYPIDIDTVSSLCPIWAVALCCLLSGCEYYPGTLVGCWCTADGWVACLYYRCFDLPFPPCCYCGSEVVWLGVRCRPGDPVPQWEEQRQ